MIPIPYAVRHGIYISLIRAWSIPPRKLAWSSRPARIVLRQLYQPSRYQPAQRSVSAQRMDGGIAGHHEKPRRASGFSLIHPRLSATARRRNGRRAFSGGVRRVGFASGATSADDYRLRRSPSEQTSKLVCKFLENNSVSSNPGKQSVSLVNGLFKIDSLAATRPNGIQRAFLVESPQWRRLDWRQYK